MAGLDDVKQDYVQAETLEAELERWMAEVAPYQWRPVRPLRPARAALLVVDMNRPFVEPGGLLSAPSAGAMVPRIAQVVAAFRQARRPVLWLVQGHHSLEHDRGEHLATWWPVMLRAGTEDVEMVAGLEPLPAEKVILKRRYSGFYQTDLELTLRCLGVTEVVIAGVLTNVCPYATAVDAFMRDLDVYYLADGTAAHNRRLHVAALQNLAAWCGAVVTVAEVCGWLGELMSDE
jgi:nicotinamidase-related amidase